MFVCKTGKCHKISNSTSIHPCNEKWIAEGTQEELKIVLGWLINTRLFTVALPIDNNCIHNTNQRNFKSKQNFTQIPRINNWTTRKNILRSSERKSLSKQVASLIVSFQSTRFRLSNKIRKRRFTAPLGIYTKGNNRYKY